MTSATKEISTETNPAAQSEAKSSLPSLPLTFSEESLKKMFESANKKARAEVPDVTTVEGRKHIRDMARNVSASNTALDTPMRDYLRVLKAQPKELEKLARESKARFDGLKVDILKPLADAQAGQDDVIDWLNSVPFECSSPSVTLATLVKTIETINSYSADLVWPELRKKFKVAHDAALTTATTNLERVETAEKMAVEVEELRAKQAASEEAEKNRVIAEAAAKEATRLAEAKAQSDREDVDRRAAESRQREENAKFAAQKAIQDAEQAKEKQAKAAEQHKIDVENERKNSLARQAEAVEKAKTEEVARLAEEEAAAAQAAKDRENNNAHKISINRAAMVDLIAGCANDDKSTAELDDLFLNLGITKDLSVKIMSGIVPLLSKSVIRAIGRKSVRNISIQY